jgi:hypothetical protein
MWKSSIRDVLWEPMRFTIRDVLLVTVIAGLVVGWAADRWRVNDWWLNRIEDLRLDLRNSDVLLYEDAEGRLRHMLITGHEPAGPLNRP